MKILEQEMDIEKKKNKKKKGWLGQNPLAPVGPME